MRDLANQSRIGGTGVYFRVLGPVEVWEQDRRIPVGTLKEQLVLAILLMESGLSISARSLADRLWDGGVDQTAVGLLMRAFARAGRLADAMAAYRNARDRLRTELGVEPGLELRTIYGRILNGEPASSPTRRASAAIVGTGAPAQPGV